MPKLARPRSLTPEESAVLEHLLDQPFSDGPILRAQVSHASVTGYCECGCPSIDLSVDRRLVAAAAGPGRPVPAEATVLSAHGEPLGGVILFLDDGYLSLLELYSFADEPVRAWPPLDQVKVHLRRTAVTDFPSSS